MSGLQSANARINRARPKRPTAEGCYPALRLDELLCRPSNLSTTSLSNFPVQRERFRLVFTRVSEDAEARRISLPVERQLSAAEKRSQLLSNSPNCRSPKRLRPPFAVALSVIKRNSPQVGLEPTTLRLTAECSAIELLRNKRPHTVLTTMQGAKRFL
jgi:hypothetical protein